MLTRTELGADALPSADAEAFEKHVREAGLMAAKAAPGPARPDQLALEVTVEEGGRSRTARMSEETMPEAARSLIEWIDSRPEREVRVEPPGGADDRSSG